MQSYLKACVLPILAYMRQLMEFGNQSKAYDTQISCFYTPKRHIFFLIFRCKGFITVLIGN